MKSSRRSMNLAPQEGDLTPFVMADGVTTLGGVSLLTNPDEGDQLWSGVWICDPKSWASPFDANEIVVVLSGSANVRLESGEIVEMRPGSTYRFDRGEVGQWDVIERLRVFAVLF